MSIDQPAFRMNTLKAGYVTEHDLPTAMRGYDKDRVDRHLARVAEAYDHSLQRCELLEKRLRSLEEELDAAKGEAAASAKSVAELMRTSPAPEQPPVEAPGQLAELEARLAISEAAREQELAALTRMSERASELVQHLEALGAEQRAPHPEPEGAQSQLADDDAVRLLVAATLAAEDVREASRARALRTLTKARELSQLARAETERANAALAETEQRTAEIKREADEILAGARAEAERVATAIDVERHRLREILTGTLASFDAGSVDSEPEESAPTNLMADLSSRLPEPSEAPETSATSAPHVT